ncbi:glycogen synthase GlgA [candidate division KSB1 bacterium]|nr:MAG: glycogen synthase GlgA [candidate division KSB1 bacterium]
MRILFVSAEITPFAKMGGLGDVSAALGKYLKLVGHDIRLVMPLYDFINRKKFELKPVPVAQNMAISMGQARYFVHVWTGKLPETNTDVYFIENTSLFNRGSVYTADADEHIRFALFSRAAIEMCQRMGWAPQIVHANDWHTALLPIYLKSIYAWDQLFAGSKTVLTIHNIGYQGVFPAKVLADLNLNTHYDLFDAYDLYHDRINFLKNGLLQAHKITTVSPTYAREIQTPEFGSGLDGILRMRSGDLVGILNGVDYDEWSPEKDPYIPFHYSPKSLYRKRKNKLSLVRQIGWRDEAANAPLLSIISRLVEQKGIELLMGSLKDIILRFGAHLVVLGSGRPEYEKFFYDLQNQFPAQVFFFRGYDYPLSHLIEAGADIFLMPSRYEPCGLNQIYSLKYGTVPVVRKTGGLADTVTLYDWRTQTGDGFVFENYDVDGLTWALEYALTTFPDKRVWQKIMRNGMEKDFSWQKQVHEYEKLYAQALERR